MSKKVLISGVTGQDGSYMADYLLKNTDYEIYGLIRRLSHPNHDNLSEALKNPRFKLITGDLSDSQSIDKVVEKIKPDYFINLAAQSFVFSSWELPEQTMDINSTGVLRCLEAIVRHCPNCRFYNAGSSEQFGDVQYSPQDEKHPHRARSPYGASKISAHHLVKTYRESNNLYAIQGLLFNHESERRGEEFVTRKITKGVARIYHAIKNNQSFEPIELGNLDAKRDWSHAEDFVDGIWKMLNQDNYCNLNKIKIDQELGAIYTEEQKIKCLSKQIKEYVLSSQETHSIREFIELAFNKAGIEGNWSFQGTIGGYVPPENEIFKFNEQILVKINPIYYRPADVEILLGNSTKARQELGWKPKVSFNELVSRMVQNDIKNYNP